MHVIMPYAKEIGKTPRYTSDVTTLWFSQHKSHVVSNFLNQVNVHNIRTEYQGKFGVTVQDSYEAYVEHVARLSSFGKIKERILYN